MPTLIVEHPRGQQLIRVDRTSALLDLCDEHGLAVALSCRAATCGSCRVSVIEGAELLDNPSERERDLIARMGAAAGQRFACAVHVRQGDGLVRLRIPANSAQPQSP